MTPSNSVPSPVSRPAAARPLRADARRNRARILEAAESVFAAKGAAASTEEIARQAGVGIGTLFRHFSTKEELIGAIVRARVRGLAEEADRLVADGDPATAFAAFFSHMAAEMAAKRAFTDLVAGGYVDVTAGDPGLVERLHRAIETLLARAREIGAVRADIGLPEAMALLAGAARAAEYAGKDRDLRNRAVTIILDAFRPAAGR
jgi:AcrR family transcriptional regulator